MAEAHVFPGEEVAVRVRPLVNEILERFNQEQTSPMEAGMVILGLVQRLMSALKDAPEARRHFVGFLVNLVNQSMAGEADPD